MRLCFLAQELCRVLFERLEPVTGDFIARTYQGEAIDYVQVPAIFGFGDILHFRARTRNMTPAAFHVSRCQCQECMYASKRVDQFLDISLPIQGLSELHDVGPFQRMLAPLLVSVLYSRKAEIVTISLFHVFEKHFSTCFLEIGPLVA